MRRHSLTLSLMAALLLSACAAETQTGGPAPVTQTPISSSAAPQMDTPTLKTPVAAADNADLPPQYQGLSPIEITRAEIDELIQLEEKRGQNRAAYGKRLDIWREQDPATRGKMPTLVQALSPEKNRRFQTLNLKLENAQIRRNYETLYSNILSKAEAQELIDIEQKQAKLFTDYEFKKEAWYKQDPATRGPRPEMDAVAVWRDNPRFMELKGKLDKAADLERMVSRVERLDTSHNISMSESEMNELAELETEQQKFEIEFEKALMEAEKQSQLTGVEVSEEDVLSNFPKHQIQRMVNMRLREDEIMAPLRAAEQAENIRTRLTELSEASGVTILSGEISESIALNAEKDQIKYNTEKEAIQKWLMEGGAVYKDTPLPNDEDYARLKEIDARLKAISAPMIEAKQALDEADNPNLRAYRLEQKAKEKWQEDWQDRQQAGEVPRDTPITRPTYAELQDRVGNYSAALESRGREGGI